MILFDLICSGGHRFEAWFKSGDAFEWQQQDDAIQCPICGDRSVVKAPMAPRLALGAAEPGGAGTDGGEPDGGESLTPDAVSMMREVLGHLRRRVEETCSYVGPAFPEEARRIHYGECESRDIYGEASSEQAEELRDEGIEIRSIPWMPRRDG
ncbi:MAG: DUF1178 family protein [Defluviicoccus sp.]|nr:MAG: DUF1178 family protein [Defluviicoccus sp.]